MRVYFQSRASGQAKDDKAEYEELKLKMRKAMGENLHDAIENETLDSQQRRLQLIRHVSCRSSNVQWLFLCVLILLKNWFPFDCLKISWDVAIMCYVDLIRPD